MEVFFNLFTMGVGFIILAIFILLIAAAIYVFNSLFMMKALTHIGYRHPWFAWIPFLNSYAIADLAKGDENGLIDILGWKFDVRACQLPTT